MRRVFKTILAAALACLAEFAPASEVGAPADGSVSRVQVPNPVGPPRVPSPPTAVPSAVRPELRAGEGPRPTARLFDAPSSSSNAGNRARRSTSLTSLSGFSGGGVPLMLGDMAPMFGPSLIHASAAGSNAVAVPWARGYKMADNQSPRPQDRLFVAFNGFNNLTQPAGSGLSRVNVYREFFGLEKTILDGDVSLGIRAPLNTITARGSALVQGGTSTAPGDLTLFAKGILAQDEESGSLISAGLAVTTPNSSSNFAGARFAHAAPTTSLQPFIGYIANFGDWFIQGFSGANLTTDTRSVRMYYNDIGAGYYLYRSNDPDALVSAVVPTLEFHINTPMNQRTRAGVRGVPDVVDITLGASFGLGRRSSLSAGLVNPLTGPRPFDVEALVLLNLFYGNRAPRPTPPPLF